MIVPKGLWWEVTSTAMPLKGGGVLKPRAVGEYRVKVRSGSCPRPELRSETEGADAGLGSPPKLSLLVDLWMLWSCW